MICGWDKTVRRNPYKSRIILTFSFRVLQYSMLTLMVLVSKAISSPLVLEAHLHTVYLIKGINGIYQTKKLKS